MPGASCRIIMRIPRPLQAVHFWTAPDFPTFLLSCNLVVFPLYKSSRDTLFGEEEKKKSLSFSRIS
uniref:Uncharacterized protein n=1 Tax=Cyprinus carpio carpio TaxID=630221 RepID=A0A9J8BQH8_CYPCA